MAHAKPKQHCSIEQEEEKKAEKTNSKWARAVWLLCYLPRRPDYCSSSAVKPNLSRDICKISPSGTEGTPLPMSLPPPYLDTARPGLSHQPLPQAFRFSPMCTNTAWGSSTPHVFTGFPLLAAIPGIVWKIRLPRRALPVLASRDPGRVELLCSSPHSITFLLWLLSALQC